MLPTRTNYLNFIKENNVGALAKQLAENPSEINRIPTFIRAIMKANAIDIMKCLINEFNYDICSSDNAAMTTCCDYDHPDMLTLLIENGADIHCGYDEYGSNTEDNRYEDEDKPDYPMYNACSKGNYNIVRVLLDHGVSPNTRNGDCLLIACERGHDGIVSLLLEKGAKEKINECLIEYCSNGDIRMIQLLIDHGANINCHENKPLMTAFKNKNHNAIRLLVQNNATLGNEKSTKEEDDFIKYLQENNIDLATVIKSLIF